MANEKHYGLGDPAFWNEFMTGVAHQQEGVELYGKNVVEWLEAEKKFKEQK